MHVRKILGSIVVAGHHHAIAKLTNGSYAVGNVSHGKKVPENEHIADFDTAVDLWLRKANYPEPGD